MVSPMVDTLLKLGVITEILGGSAIHKESDTRAANWFAQDSKAGSRPQLHQCSPPCALRLDEKGVLWGRGGDLLDLDLAAGGSEGASIDCGGAAGQSRTCDFGPKPRRNRPVVNDLTLEREA